MIICRVTLGFYNKGMSYEIGTRFRFHQERIIKPRQHKLWDVGTRIIFLKSIDDAAESIKLRIVRPSASAGISFA